MLTLSLGATPGKAAPPAAQATPNTFRDIVTYCGLSATSDNDLYATVFDLIKNKFIVPPADLLVKYNGLLQWEKSLKDNLPVKDMPLVWTDISNIIRGFTYYEAEYLSKVSATWGPAFRDTLNNFANGVNANASALGISILAAPFCTAERKKDAAATAAAVAAATAAKAAADKAAADALLAVQKIDDSNGSYAKIQADQQTREDQRIRDQLAIESANQSKQRWVYGSLGLVACALLLSFLIKHHLKSAS